MGSPSSPSAWPRPNPRSPTSPQLGRPEHFTITVRDVQLAGAGFLVIAGDILRMAALPKVPRAHKVDIRNGVADSMM